VLRNHLGLTGTKYGCGTGFCGACTVLITGMGCARSCMLPVSDMSGKEVITIEGLAMEENPSDTESLSFEHDALQCGYCTPV